MKRNWLYFFIPVLSLLTLNLNAQCDTVNLGNDTTLCEGLTLQLDAGAGFTSYLWNNGSTDQFLEVTEPGYYSCEVELLDSSNQVLNGDFESGNSFFYTDYIWGIGGPWGILSEEGTYVIDENAANTHTNFSPCVDHTSGDGLFMIVNGDTVQGENVWCQSVMVEQNTAYYFSGWFTSVHPSNPAILSYYINGEVIETVFLSGSTCIWENFIKEWNSGDNTTAEICIINQNTELGGNDFAIDDIHLLKFCVSTDSILVSFDPPPEVNLGNDTVLCGNQELELVAGGGYLAYLWSNGSGDSSLTVTQPGVYWVKVTSENGCIGSDTVVIEYMPGIEFELANDTTLCGGTSLLLDAGSGWVSYLWYDSTTSQTNLVSQAGYYWVIVEDENGCTGSDTIHVGLSPAVVVSLGGDTTVCSGDNYVLNPGQDFTSYLWQDGSTGSSYPANTPGTYWVSVTDVFGCSGSDTVTVGVNPSPQVSLGNDTVICTGSTLLLDPGSQYSSYLWQDNSNFPVFTVNSSGLYSVTVTNIYDCPASSEVFVDVSSPEIDLGPDTILCLGDTLYLDPGQGYTSYLWQDNSTNPIYPTTTGGVFYVAVTDNFNCVSEEEIEVSSLAKPQADLGGDQSLCVGSSLMLETAEGPYDYSWNGELGSNSKEITTGGVYTVEVSNACGSKTDQVMVTEVPLPGVNLGPDQVLEPGETIELDAGAGYDEYLWQDGSGSQYYVVSSESATEPYYWVEVWDGSCKNSDTTKVELFFVKLPNVITPNGDGKNDIFMPMEGGWSGVNRHHIDIFNRWGEKVWESDNLEEGWDGKRDGADVAEGTYFWVLEVFYGTAELTYNVKGTLTVLRSFN